MEPGLMAGKALVRARRREEVRRRVGSCIVGCGKGWRELKTKNLEVFLFI